MPFSWLSGPLVRLRFACDPRPNRAAGRRPESRRLRHTATHLRTESAANNGLQHVIAEPPELAGHAFAKLPRWRGHFLAVQGTPDARQRLL